MESGVYYQLDDATVQRVLQQVVDSVRRPNPLMRAIGYVMRTQTLRHFDAQRDGKGKRWPELAPATLLGRRDVAKAWGKTKGARDKQKAGDKFRAALRGVKPLQDTGTLKRTIHSVAEATSVDIGSSLHYSDYQQSGAPRAHIPARQYLYVDASDAVRIEDVTVAYIERRMTGA